MPLGGREGLGNEMFAWGKAYIASRALDLTLLPPAFGPNPRGYWRYFRKSRFDWVVHRGLRAALPKIVFTEAEFRKREELGFAGALQAFAKENRLYRRQPFLLCLEGMWGGFQAVNPARDYLLSQLLSARWTLSNLFALDQRLPIGSLTIGFHIRRGDFRTEPHRELCGKWNCAIPLDWYVAIARNLRRQFGSCVTFLVISDASNECLAPFGSEISCLFTSDQHNRDISDLLALARCDLIVCSVSSYSMWAAFFSCGRYVWLAPHLTVQDKFASIWGHERAQQLPHGQTIQARETVEALARAGQTITAKGVPVGWDGVLSDELLRWLEQRMSLRRRETDLLRYGVVSQ